MKRQLLLFLIINCVFLFYGFDLKQHNPEELFLSDKNFQELKSFRREFGEDEMTFASGLTKENLELLESKVNVHNGEFVSIHRLLPNHVVFTLPKELSDESKFSFFKEVSELNPNITFAGATFTNAHLAGMSLKIQKVIFPIIFCLMFICLMIIFRNIQTTIYLFLTSFVGVSVGLTIVKLFFSYSTILTSLTPLVSFILTLANQMHVIFGIHTYKNKKDFLKHKLRPILIMMITTVIGFAGLIYSDLISIRQFGLATTTTLIITWAINLIFLSTFKLDFKFPPKFIFNIKRPAYKPKLALLICLILLIGGIYSLKKVPTLVEAIFFFPKDHPVQLGHTQIEKDLGGTPQFDFKISKTNGTPLSYDDLMNIAKFENHLHLQNWPLKILSLNELIITSNKLYTGNSGLPDNENAYYMLRGQIPEMLRRTLYNDTNYKISFLSPPLSNQYRKSYIEKLKLVLQQIPTGFRGEISGLNYLLLESQDQLVTTLLSSLMGSFLLIAGLFSLFSRNVKEIFFFSVMSLSSIFGGLLLMNIFGFSLNVSSIMILSISIGLIDDSTIHLLYAHKHGETEERIQTSCILPMMFSNIVLLISFLLLGVESFIPIKEFSWGLVLMLSTGLILDLFILPMFTAKKIS